RLQQVILNLMSNAIKFTSNGKISIDVRLLQDETESVLVEFSIADTGVGISEDKLQLIFENFEQAYNGNNFFGGTGLGLSIVKKLLEAQGGSIYAKSKLNAGSVFIFTLSFQKTNEKHAFLQAEEFEEEAVENSVKVMVVEDISLNQLLMKTLLTDFGFKYDLFDNGKVAVEKLAEDAKKAAVNYDIILMDLQMPEMDGFEATEYIRNQLHINIPIIALTADITMEVKEKCKSAGMNDYIAKPIDEKLLLFKITDLLSIPTQRKNLRSTLTKLPESDSRGIDLTYLRQRTKSDPKLIKEMIGIYLAQTPALINSLKKSIENNDLPLLRAAAHKLLPSFTIMGIDLEFCEMIKKIQKYEGGIDQLNAIKEMIITIESVCENVYTELQEELAAIERSAGTFLKSK
ncbi:MAG: ATP-binding protein, partial [Ferruginibacter sp.]